jgi:serine/threonine protein kinase
MLPLDTLLQSRYRLTRLIKKSGMSAVYEAIDVRFESTVAVKQIFILNDELRAELRKAFEREARLLNKLRHAALPVVHDYFIEADGQFLVMQFIPGEDLEERLKRLGRPFDVGEVLNWADNLLDALEYLHGQDPPVIHRDIKPANLKLTTRGEIILLDFGLAKESQGMSIYGYTQEYAPFEQIQGLGTDPRSDLYSLAATLYRLMTGELPPDALTRAGSMMRGQADPLVAAHVVRPEVPLAISEMLNRAMAQSIDDRFPSAAAMRRGLYGAIQSSGPDRIHGREPSGSVIEPDRRRLYIPLEYSEPSEPQAETRIRRTQRQAVPIRPNDENQMPDSSSAITPVAPAELRPWIQSRGNIEETESLPRKPFVTGWHKYLRLSSWSFILLASTLTIILSVVVYKVWKTVAAYHAYREAAQLMGEHTEDARKRALEKFKVALALSEAAGSKIGQADILRNMGILYQELGDKQMALDSYGKAIALYREKGDRQAEANTLQDIGAVYAKFGEPQKAQQYYDMASQIK